MKTHASKLLPAALLALGFAGQAQAADGKLLNIDKPDYITESSISAKLGYDSNVFCVDNNLAGRPAVADQNATLFTVSPRLMLNGAKVTNATSNDYIQSFTFGYAGDYNFYNDFSESENNYRHSIPISLKMKNDAWSFSLENTALYVDGSTKSPLFANYNAYGTATVRERREQIQDRFSTSLRYDLETIFIRAVGNVLAYDLMTTKHNGALEASKKGYQNWVDRSDKNVGLDFGYKVNKDLAGVAAVRMGEQTQDRYPWGGLHSPNTYHRFLAGFEGKLTDTISGSLLAGVQQTKYSDRANSGIYGRTRTRPYAEGNITAVVTDSDKLVFTTKVWQWVSSTGTAAYLDSSYSLSWKHSWTKELSSSVGGKWAISKYEAPTVRDDQLLSYPVSVNYAFSKDLSVTAEYQYNQAKSRIKASGRVYDQNLYSIALKLAL